MRHASVGSVALTGLVIASCACSHAATVAVRSANCTDPPPRRPHPDACYLGTTEPDVPGAGTHTMEVASGLHIVSEPAGLYPRCTPGAVSMPAAVRYIGHAELPDAVWAHGLSGLHWTGTGAQFDAVQDNAYRGSGPWVIGLSADETLGRWTGHLQTVLTVQPYDNLEGVTTWQGSLIVSTDGDGPRGYPQTPHIVRPVATPPMPIAVDVPEVMRTVSHNSGIEALSATPDGRTLYFGLERPQQVDGRCEDFVRIARVRDGTPTTIYRYRPSFEGGGEDVGLAEMVALADDTLLTLERGYTVGVGSSVRIFMVHLHAPAGTEPDGTSEKALVVDLHDLPRAGFDTPASTGQRAHPALGNYEGMALGPCLSDGSRSMVLVTDDNWDSSGACTQVRRVLVLALTWP